MNKIEKLKHVLLICGEGKFAIKDVGGKWWSISLDGGYIADVRSDWTFKRICEAVIEGMAKSSYPSSMEYIHAISGAAINEG